MSEYLAIEMPHGGWIACFIFGNKSYFIEDETIPVWSGKTYVAVAPKIFETKLQAIEAADTHVWKEKA